MNLESPLYTHYVAMSLFCESFGFFVCKQWKETVSSKVGICLKKEQDGQASEWQETKAAPGLSSQNWQPFSLGCSLRWQASPTPNFLPLYSKSNSRERSLIGSGLDQVSLLDQVAVARRGDCFDLQSRGKVGRRGTELNCYSTALCLCNN